MTYTTKHEVELSCEEIEKIIKAYFDRGHVKNITISPKLEEIMTDRIVVTVFSDSDAEQKLKQFETKEQQKSKTKGFVEPEYRIDDTIIIIGITKEGKEIVKKYGNVWKLSTASNKPPRFFMYSRSSDIQGKFRGLITGKKSSEGYAVLHKEQNSPARMFRVIAVCKFPQEFKWQPYWKKLEDLKIDIKSLDN